MKREYLSGNRLVTPSRAWQMQTPSGQAAQLGIAGDLSVAYLSLFAREW